MGDNKFSKKQIFPQMFDVRPTDRVGNLDLKKIEKIIRVAEISKKEEGKDKLPDYSLPKKIKKMEDLRSPSIFEEEARRFVEMLKEEKEFLRKKKKRIPINAQDVENVRNVSVEFISWGEGDFSKEEEENILPKKSISPLPKIQIPIGRIVGRNFLWLGKFAFASAFLIVFFIGANSAIKLKNRGMVKGESAIAELVLAKDAIKKGNFDESYIKFEQANEKLSQVSDDLGILGGSLANFTKYIPYLSKISSGSNIIKAGENISQAGKLISEILKNIENIKQGSSSGETVSYLELFQNNSTKLKEISVLLEEAQDFLADVKLDDIPKENRSEFMRAKSQLPILNSALAKFLDQERILVDILGGNGPRKYLFLFQNNQEMRATGGFIGSYGLLDIFNGRVRNFFIDGIFNPDGQLREKVVPPLPIQKISAAWSLHDSNWFPDFPVSAEKASFFYEKTGGPTVDGIITMTPTVMQKLLEITGPIEMPEYGVSVDEHNFIEKIQYEVEIDYDKELNQPKKILSDLAPKVLDKVFNSQNFADFSKTANVFLASLNQKQILIYSKNWEIEKVLSENGWSGEILDTPNDYLSVINTNINGFKTDGVIEEKITHEADIQEDGTIVDTVTIIRKHTGGDSPYEWWNKVNANYLRVYVPKGARLISAEGQTREFNSSPLDYNALGFKRDAQVQMEEDSVEIDEKSGTRIYEDSGKTVFANWVYVSPKETVTLKYVYVLPFKINLNMPSSTGAYSLLAQKQSGSQGSEFITKINYPELYKISWQYPEKNLLKTENLSDNQAGVRMETDLITDKFIGLSFLKN